jgi:hypothetical protein
MPNCRWDRSLTRPVTPKVCAIETSWWLLAPLANLTSRALQESFGGEQPGVICKRRPKRNGTFLLPSSPVSAEDDECREGTSKFSLPRSPRARVTPRIRSFHENELRFSCSITFLCQSGATLGLRRPPGAAGRSAEPRSLADAGIRWRREPFFQRRGSLEPVRVDPHETASSARCALLQGSLVLRPPSLRLRSEQRG